MEELAGERMRGPGELTGPLTRMSGAGTFYTGGKQNEQKD
jgi:hypothetical protein